MTEDEAKTKTCPQTFGWECAEVRDILHSSECIGSDCAMWKWDIKTNRELAGAGAKPNEGYCGLIK